MPSNLLLVAGERAISSGPIPALWLLQLFSKQ